MKPARGRSAFSLILCNVLGTHNKKACSGTGKVHYCSRCGRITRDDRRQGLHVAAARSYRVGQRVTFGRPGQDYRGTVASVNMLDDRITLAGIEPIPRWRSALAKPFARIFRRAK